MLAEPNTTPLVEDAMSLVDPIKRAAARHRYYVANRERTLALAKTWVETHVEQRRATSRKNRIKRTPELRTYNRNHKREKRTNSPEFRRATRAAILLWNARHPERLAAHGAVYRAVKKGFLTRPSSCSKCGKACKPHGHHHKGYAREFWLDVVWLCLECHLDEHYPLPI